MPTRTINRLMVWLDTMENAHALRGLDDRMLDDMSIARDEVARRAAGAPLTSSAVAKPNEDANEPGEAVPAWDRCARPRRMTCA